MSYYFIAIGGSGAKVLESFTHMCAAGLMPDDEPIYVMDIDPDNNNGNLTRGKETFEAYKSAKKLKLGKTQLCKTRVHENHPSNYVWSPINDGNKNLDAVMSYSVYSGTPIGQLYEALYTHDERTTQLDVGFRGHPAIGAAVLAKNINSSIESKEPWSSFKRCVKNDTIVGTVKIFIAGSIFGGTGAAGIPNVAKLIRNMFSDVNDKIIIGAGMVLPYFSCQPTSEEKKKAGMCVTSTDFMPNTQAALKYYYVDNQNEHIFNSMYFAGAEDMQEGIIFSTGNEKQKNDAHIVDFYTAMAAVDFFGRKPNHDLTCYYIGHEKENIYWKDFPTVQVLNEEDNKVETKLHERIDHLARFIYTYAHLIRPVLADLKSGRKISAYKYPWYVDYLQDKGIDLSTEAANGFNSYVDKFLEWSYQISQNNSSLISPDIIHKIDETTIPVYKVNGERIVNAIGDVDTGVDVDEVWYRLCESANDCDDNDANGLGKFLRLLYDCCEA